MADENKISLEIEVDERSLDSSFGQVEKRGAKSAKASALAFEEAFQNQESELQAALDKLVKDTSKAAQTSAKESASVFQKEFERQNKILLASQKQNIDNAISKITNSDAIKKSAAESAAAFEELLPPLDKVPPVSPFNLTNLAAGVYLVKQAYLAIKEVASAASEFIAEGEKIVKGEARFKALAEQAGVAASVIQNDLVGAAKGLIDDDDLIQLASESFVQLGKNAERLPEILELARKSYKVFGGDVVSNVEKINQAIFTGNTRALRQMGILVDATQVYKNYAKEIGTVPALLSETQKQQALMNQVLLQGSTRFKNVTTDSNSYDESLKRLIVSTSDLIDEGKKIASGTIGKSFAVGFEESARQIGVVSGALKALTDGKSVDGIKGKIDVLNETLKVTESQYANLTKIEKFFLGPAQKKLVEEQTNAIAQLNAELAIARGDLASAQKGSQAQKPPEPIDPTVQEEFKRRQQELAKKVIELNSQMNQSEVSLAQARLDRSTNLENVEKLNYERRLQAETTFQGQKADLEKFFAENGVNDALMRTQAREALEQTHVNNLLMIQGQYEQQRKEIIDNSIADGYNLASTFDDIAKGIKSTQADLEKTTRKNFKAMGESIRDGLGTASANAFAAFGAALANGDDALQAFVQTFLNSIGQMAIQSGARFILEGLAWLTVPGFQGVGSAMIAAGAALATFGGALTALTGGGSTNVQSGYGPDTTVGGGVTNDTSPITTVEEDEDREPEAPKVQVSLTVQGNILNNRETGLELAQIIADQFSEQGLVFKGA